MPKAKVNLTIDADLKRRAIEQDVSFSDILETQLKTLVPLLEKQNCATKCPACGAWTVTIFKERKNDLCDESQYICDKCGEVFWASM